MGKYQHLKKEKKKVEENVIDLDALDQELASGGMPIGEAEDSEISFDIELPERLRKKREKAKIQNYDNDGKTDGDDVLIGAAIIGLTAVIPLDDQDLDNMRDN